MTEIVPGTIPIDDILRAVCKICGVTKDELLGKERFSHIVEARALLGYASFRRGWSYRQLSKWCGRGTHTTYCNASRRMRSMLKSGIPQYRERAEWLLCAVNQELGKAAP